MKLFVSALSFALTLCVCIDHSVAASSSNVKGATTRDFLDKPRTLGVDAARTLRGKSSSESRSKGPKIYKMTRSSSKSSEKSKRGGKSSSVDFEEVISLGNYRPEGVARGPGPTIFVTRMLWGGVVAVNVETGDVEEVVPNNGFLQRFHVGLKYYRGALFVAGGGPASGVDGNVYVYNATTGEEIATCAPDFDEGFLNDLTIAHGNVYVTDSLVNKIMVLNAGAAVAGECQISSLDLPEMFLSTDGSFYANGIAGYGDGFLFVDRTRGGYYYFDTDDNSVINVVSPEVAPIGDGMIIQGGKLYVTENDFDRISVWTLDGLNIEIDGYITSPYFDTPTTSAIYGGYIFSCNARFGSAPFGSPIEGNVTIFDENFDLVGVEISSTASY